MIVYDAAVGDIPLIKFGDGKTNVNELPFVFEYITVEDINEICGTVWTKGEEAEL